MSIIILSPTWDQQKEEKKILLNFEFLILLLIVMLQNTVYCNWVITLTELVVSGVQYVIRRHTVNLDVIQEGGIKLCRLVQEESVLVTFRSLHRIVASLFFAATVKKWEDF